MAETMGQFRGALGGFNRQDVAQYIEKSSKEHQEKVEALQAELEQTRKERDALAAELGDLRAHSGDLAEQEAKVRASLEESTQSLTRMRGELQVTQGHLATAKKELGDLQGQVAQLEPMAKQYEILKDRVATVELDAHRKAQETVSQAEAQALQIRKDAVAGMAELCREYEALRGKLSDFVLGAEEMQRAFDAQEEAYQTLRRRTEEEQP